MKVAAHAVVHLIKLLALADGEGAVFIRIRIGQALGGVSRSNVAHLHALAGCIGRRGFAEVALLARAACQQQRSRGDPNPFAAHLSLASVPAAAYSGTE